MLYLQAWNLHIANAVEIATACSIKDTYGAEKKLSSNMIGAMVSLSEEEWLIARAIGYVCLSLLPLVLPIIYDSDVSSCHVVLVIICPSLLPHVPPIIYSQFFLWYRSFFVSHDAGYHLSSCTANFFMTQMFLHAKLSSFISFDLSLPLSLHVSCCHNLFQFSTFSWDVQIMWIVFS